MDNNDFLQLIPECNKNLKVLVLYEEFFLPELIRRMPKSEFHICISKSKKIWFQDKENIVIYKKIFDKKQLPFENKKFDYILAGRYFEKVINPIFLAREVQRCLKLDGYLIGIFGNIRCLSVLEGIMQGHFTYKERNAIVQNDILHFFTLKEIINLMKATFYKDISFMPCMLNESSLIFEKLMSAGFENEHNDLNTEFWFLKAARDTKETRNLKSLYTEGQRRKISCLLRRIENAIELEKNCAILFDICQTKKISGKYIVDFAQNTLLKPEKSLVPFAVFAYEKGECQWAINILHENIKEHKDEISIYALASLLYIQNNIDEATKVIAACETASEEIKQLADLIKAKQ